MLCMLAGKIARRLDVRAERETSDGEGMTRLGAVLCATWNQKNHNLLPQAPHLKRICTCKL